MIKYVKIFCDMSGTVDVLSDAEAGRLLKAILHYGMDGTDDQLPGQEKLVFQMLRAQIDRDRESYAQKAQRNRENGSKGGRPRKPTGTQQNPVGFQKTQQNPTKPTKSQDKDKDKDKSSPLPPSQGDDDDDDDDLMLIARRHSAVYDAAERAGFPMSGATMDKLTELISLYGADAVDNALDSCVEYGARSIAYLRKVLEGKPRPSTAPTIEELNGGYKPLWG